MNLKQQRRQLHKRFPQAKALLNKLAPADRLRVETLQVAAENTRKIAHVMLDSQLDAIMPELLTAIDAGHQFAVLIVDPEQMPVMPEKSVLLDANGQKAESQGLGLVTE